jgi:hypothetical protein
MTGHKKLNDLPVFAIEPYAEKIYLTVGHHDATNLPFCMFHVRFCTRLPANTANLPMCSTTTFNRAGCPLEQHQRCCQQVNPDISSGWRLTARLVACVVHSMYAFFDKTTSRHPSLEQGGWTSAWGNVGVDLLVTALVLLQRAPSPVECGCATHREVCRVRR